MIERIFISEIHERFSLIGRPLAAHALKADRAIHANFSIELQREALETERRKSNCIWGQTEIIPKGFASPERSS